MAKTVNRQLNVKMTGDNKGFVAASDGARKSGERYEKQVKRINGKNKKFGEGFRTAANSATILNGPLNGISGRLSALSTGMSTFGPLTLAGGVAITALSFAMTRAVTAASQYEVEMGRLEAIVKATGGTAGFSAQQIDEQARAIGRSTLANATDIRKAAGVLATFRTIQGQTFKETLKLTQDLAAVMGTSASAAALQFGKALEDPATGLTSLKRSGVSFTESEKELIQTMQKSGDLLGAQTLIIEKLKAQIGGAGAGQNKGVIGAVDLLGENWTELLEIVGQSSGATSVMESFFNTMARGAAVASGLLKETDVERQSRLWTELLELQFKTGANPRAQQAIDRQVATKRAEFAAVSKVIEDERQKDFKAYQTSQASKKKLREENEAARVKSLNKEIEAELEKQQDKNLKLQEQSLNAQGKNAQAEALRYENIKAQTIIELEATREKLGSIEAIEAEFRDRQENESAAHEARLTKINNDETIKREKVESRYSKTVGNMRLEVANQAADALSGMVAEGSKASKALFLVSKGLAVAQIIMNTQIASIRALAELGPIAGPPMAATMQSLGYASAAIVAGTALAGVAHGGLENVKEEGTFLLQKGERVLSPNQNKQLMEDVKGGGNVINIHNYAGADVSTEENGGQIDIIINKVKQAVSDDISRGTGVGITMQSVFGISRRGAV